jgi:hypothetical protein
MAPENDIFIISRATGHVALFDLHTCLPICVLNGQGFGERGLLSQQDNAMATIDGSVGNTNGMISPRSPDGLMISILNSADGEVVT